MRPSPNGRAPTARPLSKSRFSRPISRMHSAAFTDCARSIKSARGHDPEKRLPLFGGKTRSIEKLASLLPRQLDRKFAVANARAEIFGKAGGCFLAISRDQLGQRQKQRGLRQAVAVDAVVRGFGPGLLKKSKRSPFLFVLGQGLVGRKILRRHSHCCHAIAAKRRPYPRPHVSTACW